MPDTENSTSVTTAATTQEPTTERTFTQAEVDALVGRRVAKATKGMPDESELAAFRTWKANQQTEADKLNSLTQERDTATAALAAANEELEQFKREKLLTGMGVSADDVDYYAFKIGKLVTEDKTFEDAAKEYLQDKTGGKVRVDLGAALSGSKVATTTNESMNQLLRGLRR
jgi:hypothetical protein